MNDLDKIMMNQELILDVIIITGGMSLATFGLMIYLVVRLIKN